MQSTPGNRTDQHTFWEIYKFFSNIKDDYTRGKEFLAYASARHGNASEEIKYLEGRANNKENYEVCISDRLVMGVDILVFAIEEKAIQDAEKIYYDLIDTFPSAELELTLVRCNVFGATNDVDAAWDMLVAYFDKDISLGEKAVIVIYLMELGVRDIAVLQFLDALSLDLYHKLPASLIKARLMVVRAATKLRWQLLAGDRKLSTELDSSIVGQYGCLGCRYFECVENFWQAWFVEDWDVVLSLGRQLFTEFFPTPKFMPVYRGIQTKRLFTIRQPMTVFEKDLNHFVKQVGHKIDTAAVETNIALAISDACDTRYRIKWAREILTDLLMSKHVPIDLRRRASRLRYRLNGCLDVSPLDTFEIDPLLLSRLGDEIDFSSLEGLGEKGIDADE